MKELLEGKGLDVLHWQPQRAPGSAQGQISVYSRQVPHVRARESFPL